MTRRPGFSWRPSPASAGLRRALVGALAVGFLVAEARAETGAAARACPNSLPKLYDRVSPAVVSIAAASVSPYDVNEPITRVVGSGFMIEASGLILTNSHLVFGRQAISVTLDDGTVLPAKLVGADPVLDIAAIRIPPPSKGVLPVAELGDALVILGDVSGKGVPAALVQSSLKALFRMIVRDTTDPAAIAEHMAAAPHQPTTLAERLVRDDRSAVTARRAPAEICEHLLSMAAKGPGPVGVEDWQDDRTALVFQVEPRGPLGRPDGRGQVSP